MNIGEALTVIAVGIAQKVCAAGARPVADEHRRGSGGHRGRHGIGEALAAIAVGITQKVRAAGARFVEYPMACMRRTTSL